jgi:geranyl diphosphate synthase
MVFLFLIYSISFVLQVAVLAGDFLLSRACVALASLKNTEVRIH